MSDSPNLLKLLKRYQEDPRSTVFAPLAEAYRKSGMLDEAIEICREGRKIHPNLATGKVAHARCLFEKGFWEEVIQLLESVVDEFPENLLSHRLLARSLDQLGETERSKHFWERVLFLVPSDAEARARIEGKSIGIEPRQPTPIQSQLQPTESDTGGFEIRSAAKTFNGVDVVPEQNPSQATTPKQSIEQAMTEETLSVPTDLGGDGRRERLEMLLGRVQKEKQRRSSF